MTGNRPEGVIFDLGGVLLSFDHMDICRGLAGVSGHTPEEVYSEVFTSGLEEAYDLGMPTTEFYLKVIERLRIPPGELGIEEFKRTWGDIFTENTEVVDILKRLRGQTRLFLLSNTNELHFGYAKKNFPFLCTTFEKTFLSFEMHLRKPQPEVFRTIISSTGIGAEGLFFIDDAPAHVEAAELTGIRAHVFKSPAGLETALGELGFDT